MDAILSRYTSAYAQSLQAKMGKLEYLVVRENIDIVDIMKT